MPGTRIEKNEFIQIPDCAGTRQNAGMCTGKQWCWGHQRQPETPDTGQVLRV